MKALLLTAMTMMSTAGPSDGPASKPIEDDPAYVAVRRDVFEAMNVADINLPKCEASLTDAQSELRRAQTNIDELKAAAEALKTQKQQLLAHIADLDAVIARYRDYTAALTAMAPDPPTWWEEHDATIALVGGWAVGTLQAVGLAWVFNQPALRQ